MLSVNWGKMSGEAYLIKLVECWDEMLGARDSDTPGGNDNPQR